MVSKGEDYMNKRILAFLIDHIIICFAFALLGVVEMFLKTDIEPFWKMYYIFLLAFMFIYFFKDVLGGQSIGKRLTKIKVVDFNGNKPRVLNLIVRNITILIWPIEALLVFLGKQRLGDKLAKTKVVEQ